MLIQCKFLGAKNAAGLSSYCMQAFVLLIPLKGLFEQDALCFCYKALLFKPVTAPKYHLFRAG